MIIQVAGTNGAGKSTVVRAVLASGVVQNTTDTGCDLRLSQVDGTIRIPGRYGDHATGGCDQFKSVNEIHDKIREGLQNCHHVVWEGGTSHGGLNQTRGPHLVEELGVSYIVVLLTTPYGQCLDGINARRAEIGRAPLPDDTDIRSNFLRARNYAARMRDAGARVIRVSREDAPKRIVNLLRGN